MDTVFSEPWTEAVTKILRKSGYVRVKSYRLQGIMLLVFCLKVHLIHLRDIETQYVKTGFGGVWVIANGLIFNYFLRLYSIFALILG